MHPQDSANLTPSRRAPAPPSHQQRQPSSSSLYGTGASFGNGSSAYPVSGGHDARDGHAPSRSQMFSSTNYAPSFQRSTPSNSSTQLNNPGYGGSPRIVHQTNGSFHGSNMLPAGMHRLSNSTSALTPIRQGMVTVKEEEGIRSFLWSKRWLVLRDQTLSFHKNEVCRVAFNPVTETHLSHCLFIHLESDFSNAIFHDSVEGYLRHPEGGPETILLGSGSQWQSELSISVS